MRFLLAALALVAACNFGLGEVPTIDNSCASAKDCERGVCNGEICVDESQATVTVAIEVLRGPTSMQRNAPVSWAYAPVSFSGSTSLDLALPSTREVQGSVRWEGEPVPATLRFVRRMEPDVAPLSAAPVEVDTLREPAAGDGSTPYDFSAVLVAGAIYDVSVLPTTDVVTAANQLAAPAIRSLPPLYFELEVTGESATEPLRFDVAFPPTLVLPCNEEFDKGCTLSAEVLSVQDEGVAVAESGLQVRAIDSVTGRVASSIAETDEAGRFSIRLNDQTDRYLIRVTSTAGRESFPAVSVDPDVAFADELAPKRIFIPRLDAVQFTGRVRDQAQRVVPGATVRFASTGIFGEQLGLEGSFTGSDTTDAEGVFGAELLPGFYSITVTPPEDTENDWGVFTTESLVGEEITATEVIIPSQVELRGLVSTYRGEAAAGVPVLAGARPAGERVVSHRSQETVSNGAGVFEMSVDAGRYDVQVKVPSETGFAWVVEPDLAVTRPGTEVARTYPLQPPIAITGSIRTSTTVPILDAVVRAYLLVDGETGPRAIQVAETAGGPDGSYRLLIPPRLAGP